jgi:tellurite resistance protein TehA-like permease
MTYAITDFWVALGVTLIVVQIAHLIVDRGTQLRRTTFEPRGLRYDYVHSAPGVGPGLASARAVLFARMLPRVALTGCFFALLSSCALTIFPKYCTVTDNADLYHALNAPFYVGLGVAYLSVMILLSSYLGARVRRRPV